MTQGLSDDEWSREEWSEPGFEDDLVAGELYASYDDGLMPGLVDEEYDSDSSTPSLPVILLSALCGVAGALFGLYVAYIVLDLGVELSAGIATLSMLLCLGATGAAISSLTGARSAPVNIVFSCGLILACVLFLVCCALCGALAASLLVGI